MKAIQPPGGHVRTHRYGMLNRVQMLGLELLELVWMPDIA